MDCGCVYVDNDGDVAQFYHATRQRARKEHVCSECRGPILPGEKYEYVAARWDSFDVLKTCPTCLAVRDAFFCGAFCHGVIWDDMQNHIDTYDGEISDECLAPLPKAARDKVCAMIQEHWDRP